MKETGLKRISEITGFSVATVSNALNGKHSVNRQTAATILRVARDVGYLTARAIRRIRLITVRTGCGILDDTPFFSSVLDGVSEECSSAGFEVSFLTLELGSDQLQDQLTALASDLNSAIILMGTELTRDEYKVFDVLPNPIVTLDYWCPNRKYSGVEFNNFDSAREAAVCLLSKGHRKIGYLRGNYRIRAFAERERGLRAALEAGGIPLDPRYVVSLGTSIDGAWQDMSKHLSGLPDLPTAFFADNDIIALGAMKALRDKGIRIPEDVSVIGFGNLPYCRISTPCLTTMDAPARQMGRSAVRRMVDLLNRPEEAVTRIQIMAALVERGSVADLTARPGA